MYVYVCVCIYIYVFSFSFSFVHCSRENDQGMQIMEAVKPPSSKLQPLPFKL